MPATPLLECEVTFISEQEGGRTTAPKLSGNVYRPHIVVGDPNQRKAVITGRMMPVEYADGTKGERWTDKYLDEEYRGVMFESGPENPQLGVPMTVTLSLPFWCAPEYEKVIPGATFTLREGPNIVGYGKRCDGFKRPARCVCCTIGSDYML